METTKLLRDFLFHLNNKSLISIFSFDYEKEIKNFKKQNIKLK